jgi:hypothetical protein
MCGGGGGHCTGGVAVPMEALASIPADGISRHSTRAPRVLIALCLYAAFWLWLAELWLVCA